MRLFVAIPLGASLEIELSRLVARVRTAAPNLRWSTPEQWHITLEFLGAATEEQCACLLTQLAAIKSAPFAIRLASLGAFHRPGVFYLGVAPAPELLALQKKVESATRPCGFEPENRPYRPHITLARSKGAAKPREIQTALARSGKNLEYSAFVATEFCLYQSHTLPSGSQYEVKARFPLSDFGSSTRV